MDTDKILAIYKIVSPSGRIYIGQSRNIRKRVIAYSNGNVKNQPKIYASINKYGWDAHSFSVIHYLPNDIEQSTLNCYESIYMAAYRDCGFKLLNVADIKGSQFGMKHTEDSKLKMSLKRKGKSYHSEYQRKRISECNKARVISEETKDKIRSSRIGKIPWNLNVTHTEATRKKISEKAKDKKRKPFTDETKRRMSEGLKGRFYSEETRLKLSKSLKAAWIKRKLETPS